MTESLRRGFPGMKSVQDMPLVQDGPPPGGFPSVRYARRLPSTGPNGFTIFAVSAVVMAYGFYRVGLGNAERRANRDEKLGARRALVPVLQAEEDKRWLEAHKLAKYAEANLMKDVEGWKMHTKVYNSGRWMPPTRPVGAPLTSCTRHKPVRRSGCAAAATGFSAMSNSSPLLPGLGSYGSNILPKEDKTRREISPAPSATASAAAPVAAAAAPGAQLLVTLATLYVIPFFGMMILAPKWKKTRQTMESFGLFVPLALMYAYLLVMSWQADTLSLMMPGDVSQGINDFSPQFFPKLEGVAKLFSRLTTAASLWIHIITINLFLAKVCYIKGLAEKLPTVHTVIIAACFGPLAILSTVVTQMAVGTVGGSSPNKPVAQEVKERESASMKETEILSSQTKKTSNPSTIKPPKTTGQSSAVSTASKLGLDASIKPASGNGLPGKSNEPAPTSDSNKVTPVQPVQPAASTPPEVSKPPASGAVEAKAQMGALKPQEKLPKEGSSASEKAKEVLSAELKNPESLKVVEEKTNLKVDTIKPAMKAPIPAVEAPKPPVEAPKPAEELKSVGGAVKPVSVSPEGKRESESGLATLVPPRKPGLFQASRPTGKSNETLEAAQPPGTVVKKSGDGFIILMPYKT